MKTKEISINTTEFTLPLATETAVLANTGGKGASLARMAAAGLPVPGGFHITTVAYKHFVAINELQPDIEQALRQVDMAVPSSLETSAASIHLLFMGSVMPEEIVQAITVAYTNLGGGETAVAVRSSATAEDLPSASFAGQQETYLNVSGVADLLQAVQRCWASLWTARAIGYRARQGIPPDDVALAVVVQQLVPAEAAGILFTANPMTGARDEVVINAAWGLGESIVGGSVTPDTVVVNKNTEAIISRETAVKESMTVLTEAGTTETAVPEAQRSAQVLDDAAAYKLLRLANEIEALYAQPMDVEWTLADGEFAIVQARPITALPAPPELVPQTWPMPNPKDHYTRGSVVDFLADPLSPLYATMGLRLYNAGLNRLVDELVNKQGAYEQDMLHTINDYAYMSLHLEPRHYVSVVGRMLVAMPRIVREVPYRWREVLRQYQGIVTHWDEQYLPEMSATELLHAAQEVFTAIVYYINTLQAGPMGAAAGAEGIFTAVYNRVARRNGDPRAATLLLGFDSTPILAEKSLYDLALWTQDYPALAGYLRRSSTALLVTSWQRPDPPAEIAADEWQAWREKFQHHLQQYGYAIYDLDFAKPLPADDPTPLFASLQMYLRNEGNDPYQRQLGLQQKREAAVGVMQRRLRGLRRKLFDKTLSMAQMLTPMREDCIAEIGLGYPVLRAMLQEIGQRLVAAGVLNAAADIFWLRELEVEATVAALDRDETLPDFTTRVARRRLQWQATAQVTPPPQLPVDAKFMGMSMEMWLPTQEDKQADDKLEGLGASPGHVEGTARVLHGPSDFDQMEPGDVLVAKLTTPAWTPLFAMAAAIVTDVGGPLSHGSIVAREFGIPAVLGTGVATRRIRSGQTITVDGDQGIVLLAS